MDFLYYNTYGSYDLDEIIQIAGADASHAEEIEAQAAGAQAISQRISEKLDELIEASGMSEVEMENVGRVLDGAWSQALFPRLFSLKWHSYFASESIKPQSGSFETVAYMVRDNHRRLVGDQEKRDDLLNKVDTDPEHPDLVNFLARHGEGVNSEDKAAVKAVVREHHNESARNQMKDTASQYLDTVNSLASVQSYQGPRVVRPDSGDGGESGSGSGGREVFERPGPPLRESDPHRPGDDTGRDDVLQPRDRPDQVIEDDWGDTDKVEPGGPILQNDNTAPPPPNPNPTPGPGGGGGGGPVPPGGGGGGVFVPPRAVTPPVIGGRGGPGATNQPITPNKSGVVKPVFGERAGKSTDSFGRPVTPGGGAGVGRSGGGAGAAGPGTGSRGAPRLGARGGVTGASGSGQPQSGAGKFGPGSRSQKTPEHRASGRVIRPTQERAMNWGDYRRTPKTKHGGNEGLNRPVIRNSRAFSGEEEEAQTSDHTPDTAPEESTANKWFDNSATVRPVITGRRTEPTEHDPGPAITPYNLGRKE